MGPEYFEPLWRFTDILVSFAAWLIGTTGCLVAICIFLGAIYMAIKEWIEEIR